jgi:hypothetical protein
VVDVPDVAPVAALPEAMMPLVTDPEVAPIPVEEPPPLDPPADRPVPLEDPLTGWELPAAAPPTELPAALWAPLEGPVAPVTLVVPPLPHAAVRTATADDATRMRGCLFIKRAFRDDYTTRDP